MDREDFDRAVYENWAQRFDCTVEDLYRAGTVLIPDQQFAGSGGVHVWQIGKRAFARMDPQVLDEIEHARRHLPRIAVLNEEHLRAALGGDRIRQTEQSVLLYLYPPDFQPHDPPVSIEVRRLEMGDARALVEMKAACTPDEVDMGEVSVEDEIGFGCFDGHTLASVATGFWLTGFMDIGVLTHPAYRGKGLGKAVVSALCTWCIERAIIAQYRCLVTNIGSYNIARALHFDRYCTQESIYLNQDRSTIG
ncbi:MAG: GNAT family N-acetyltransferase [Anaerolineae bacterium]